MNSILHCQRDMWIVMVRYIAILGKVVTELEGMPMVSANIIERLFTADLAFLQDMYQRINDVEPPVIHAVCPKCGEAFDIPVNFIAEG